MGELCLTEHHVLPELQVPPEGVVRCDWHEDPRQEASPAAARGWRGGPAPSSRPTAAGTHQTLEKVGPVRGHRFPSQADDIKQQTVSLLSNFFLSLFFTKNRYTICKVNTFFSPLLWTERIWTNCDTHLTDEASTVRSCPPWKRKLPFRRVFLERGAKEEYMEGGAWFELIESRLSSSVSVIIEFRGLSKGPKLFESLCNKTRVIC